jgi:hypothetical protein
VAAHAEHAGGDLRRQPLGGHQGDRLKPSFADTNDDQFCR